MKSIIFVICLISTSAKADKLFPEKEQQHCTCFGSFGSLTDATCAVDERIAPSGVFLGSKPNSSNCPDSPATGLSERFVRKCCCPDVGDCTGAATRHLHPSVAEVYYSACMGRMRCRKYQASRITTSSICSSRHDLLKYTNYMYITYSCKKVSKIGILPWVDLRTTSPEAVLYLQRHDYEHPDNEAPVSCVACSVKTSDNSRINVIRLHLDFVNDGHLCNQSITINDKTGKSSQISCGDNSKDNDFNITVLYTSESNEIELVYHSFTDLGGQFWLGFTANGSLTITCPVQSNTSVCKPLAPTESPSSKNDFHEAEQERYLCYGSSLNDLTKGRCPSSKKILIKDFMLGSKPDDMGCLQKMYGVPNETEYHRCCSPKPRDCSGRLIHLQEACSDAFYTACMGKTRCTPRPTVNAPTPLKSCKRNTTYLPFTNYMYFAFSCIPDSLIGRLPTVSTLHTNRPGEALYLQKRDYDKFDRKSSSGTCSIAVDCESYINITQLHINFTSTATGVCLENLTFSENGTKLLYLDCKDNSQHNEHMQKVIGVSVGNFIQMTYKTESFDVGHFWIGFTSSSNGNIQVKCPADKQDCSKVNRPVSNVETDIQNVFQYTTTILGIAVGAFLLIVTGISTVICCSKQRSERVKPQPKVLQRNIRKCTSTESIVNKTKNPPVNISYNGNIEISKDGCNSRENREPTFQSNNNDKQEAPTLT